MAYRLSLQSAYEKMLKPYEDHFQFALTLTLKLKAKIRTRIHESAYFERDEYLNDEKLNSTIRYFNALMNQSIYGNHTKHKNKRDWAEMLSFYSIEGGDGIKRLHLHAAIGNIPAEKIESVEAIAIQNWHRCDFGHEKVDVERIYNASGWVGYMTKTVKMKNYDALDVESATIPKVIEVSSVQKVV